MIILRETQLGAPAPCPYFNDRDARFEYFFAFDLSGHELDGLLSKGWRKFSTYYFLPRCGGCRRCVPVRVLAGSFKPVKSQRRVMRLAESVETRISPLIFNEEIYDVYREHSLSRFGRVTDRDEFIHTFYVQSCPSLQSEYYLDGKLFAAGFLDHSHDALSSVYFVFRPEYGRLSPGVLSVIRETEFAASLRLKYYYLGYYIALNRSMSYKYRFRPLEWYRWDENRWLSDDASPLDAEQ